MDTVVASQCVILVLGRGPPPLLACGGHPFLFWLAREATRFGVAEILVLTDDPAVAAALPVVSAALPRPVRMDAVDVPAGLDDRAALQVVESRLAPRFLLCDGRAMADLNLAPLLAGDPEAVLSPQGRVVVALMERGGAAPGRTSMAEGWTLDLRQPADLARAPADVPRRLQRPALFLDRDGTINRDHGYVGARDRWEWVDGAIEAIRLATGSGWHVFVVTNQSGIARGLYDEAALDRLHRWMADELRRAGGTVDDIRYCPFHEDASVPRYRCTSSWRKPEPGMVLDLLARWRLDPSRCILIGDQPSDMAAARAAAIRGVSFDGVDLLATVRPLLAASRPV